MSVSGTSSLRSLAQVRGSSRAVENFLSERISQNQSKSEQVLQQTTQSNETERSDTERLWASFQYAVEYSLLSDEERNAVLAQMQRNEQTLSQLRLSLAQKNRMSMEALNNPIRDIPEAVTVVSISPTLQVLSSQTIPSSTTQQSSSTASSAKPVFRAGSGRRAQQRTLELARSRRAQRFRNIDPVEEKSPKSQVEQSGEPEETFSSDVGLEQEEESKAAKASLEQVQEIETAGDLLVPSERKLLDFVLTETGLANELLARTAFVPSAWISQQIYDQWLIELNEYYTFIDQLVAGPALQVVQSAEEPAFVNLYEAIRTLSDVLFDVSRSLRTKQQSSASEQSPGTLPSESEQTLKFFLRGMKQIREQFPRVPLADLVPSVLRYAMPVRTFAEAIAPVQTVQVAETKKDKIDRALKSPLSIATFFALIALLWQYLDSSDILVRPIVTLLKYFVTVAIDKSIGIPASLRSLTNLLTEINLYTRLVSNVTGMKPEKVRGKLLEFAQLGDFKKIMIMLIPEGIRKLLLQVLDILQLRLYKKTPTSKFLDEVLTTLTIS